MEYLLTVYTHCIIGPFEIKLDFILILKWISSYIRYKVKDELLIHSQTSTVQPLKFGNGYIISCHTLQGIWLITHATPWYNPVDSSWFGYNVQNVQNTVNKNW